MRYRVVVSRVQVSERFVRGSSEEEAAKRVQSELDQPYGYLGSWRTISTDVDITEVTSPIRTAPAQVAEGGAVLLSIKEAAKHLGVSYSVLYEMVNTAEVQHVAIGRRKYITRNALNAFVDTHTRLGRSTDST